MLTFNKMRQQGLMPNIVSYGTIIDGLCKIGRMDDAMSQFSMIDNGLSPDMITFTTLIHGFSMYDKWEKAEELFYEMMDRGIPPNVSVFMSCGGKPTPGDTESEMCAGQQNVRAHAWTQDAR
jgi:leucine-rich PPR motif-containing protein